MRYTLPLLLVLGFASTHDSARAETGACCFVCDPRFCEIMTEEECANEPDGYYLGDGTTCEECPTPSDVPDPQNSTVVPADAMNGLFVCPASPVAVTASQIRVTVRNTCDEPIVGASVVVTLTADNPTCSGAALQGTTNGAGEALLILTASGCRANQALSGLIKANGVTIRSYNNVKSPDSDANGGVSLPDLQAFAREFLGQTADRCHDYDNDGQTRLPDLVLFSAAFSQANHCAP